MKSILNVDNLVISFKTNAGKVQAVRGVSFELYQGETLAIVGESGSGKSVTSRAIMGILSGNALIEQGSIIYEGEDLVELEEADFHKIRGKKIGMIFQDPMSSLNPIMKIGKQITEGLLLNGNRINNKIQELTIEQHTELNNKRRIFENLKQSYDAKQISDQEFQTKKLEFTHEVKRAELNLKNAKADAAKLVKKEVEDRKALYVIEKSKIKENYTGSDQSTRLREAKEAFNRFKKVTKKEAYERAIEVMREVGIPDPEKRYNQYPFQFSGGMRQRIVIAIALTANPDLLICDEPTTALDVTIQAQILELINELKAKRNLSVIFITHDLGVVANMADRIAVMYAGKFVEVGSSHEVFYDPRHPYTWALLGSMPDLESDGRLSAIPGTPPNMLFPPVGDAFAVRNQYAMKIDFEQQPPMFDITTTHRAATWLLHKDAPRIQAPEFIERRKQMFSKEYTA